MNQLGKLVMAVGIIGIIGEFVGWRLIFDLCFSLALDCLDAWTQKRH